MIDHMQKYYAFGNHKGIDFDQTRIAVLPMATKAQAENDAELFAEATHNTVYTEHFVNTDFNLLRRA